MNEIKRYEFCWDINGAEIVESKHGEYIKFDDHAAEVERLKAEIAALKARLQFTYCAYCGERFDVADEDAAKKAVEEHIFKCEKHPIAALTAALDEATMLLHEFQTDCGWDTTLERDFANIKTPASRALCERLFGGGK